MENSFKKSISVEIDKKMGIAILSIIISKHKAEVYRIPISDMEIILNEFREGMRSNDNEFKVGTFINNENP